jgi:hypothetical protein
VLKVDDAVGEPVVEQLGLAIRQGDMKTVARFVVLDVHVVSSFE